MRTLAGSDSSAGASGGFTHAGEPDLPKVTPDLPVEPGPPAAPDVPQTPLDPPLQDPPDLPDQPFHPEVGDPLDLPQDRQERRPAASFSPGFEGGVCALSPTEMSTV